MNNKIWEINATLYCQQLTSEYVEDVITLIETAFFPDETVCSVLQPSEDPEALIELRELLRVAIKDGVTIIAINKRSKKIVGAALNRIQVKDNPILENFAKSWKRPKSIEVVEFMSYIENIHNLFDHHQVDCLFEQMFLDILPEYRGQGIGTKLLEATVDVATSLAKGINAKQSTDGTAISLEPAPKIVCSIFTSIATQKAGRKLGFKVAVEISYGELEFQGKRFSSVLPKGTENLTFEYKIL